MTEKELHDYTAWLTEVWSNYIHIPFMEDAPRAYLYYLKRNNISIGCPEWLTEEVRLSAKKLWNDTYKVDAIRTIKRNSENAGCKVTIKEALELFKQYCE